MMLWYLLKLAVVLPLIAGFAWGSLRLARGAQTRLARQHGPRAARVIETQLIGPGLRLAVIEFHGREILVSASKAGLARLAEAPARGAAPQGDAA